MRVWRDDRKAFKDRKVIRRRMGVLLDKSSVKIGMDKWTVKNLLAELGQVLGPTIRAIELLRTLGSSGQDGRPKWRPWNRAFEETTDGR
jgi:hypothetical protein